MRTLLLAVACLSLACDALKPGLKKCGNCPDNSGEFRCDGRSLLFCNLESPTSDCYSWEILDCGPGFTCVPAPQPACESTCAGGHACAAGALRCTTSGHSERCGLVSGCNAWLAAEPCSGGGSCECQAGALRCTSSGERQVCGLSGNCYAWEPPGPCGAAELCSAMTGACEVACLASAISSAALVHDRPACALVGGQAYCWGRNESGQLGTGDTGRSSLPRAATALGGGLTQLAVLGAGGTTCVRSGGALRCLGSNAAGALGAGSPLNYSTAALAVSALSGAVELAAGSRHACAALADGSAWCWGAGELAQLGDTRSGGSTSAATPVAVAGLSSGVERIFCGHDACCARRAGGEVRCWGYLQPLFFSATPLSQPALAGAEEIALARGQLCARVGGGVVCAGLNARGSLGDGTRSDRGSFAPVAGLPASVVALAPLDPADAGTVWCALASSGSLWCWGPGGAGQLLPAEELEPVEVDAGAAVTALGGHLFLQRADGTWWSAEAPPAPVVGCR